MQNIRPSKFNYQPRQGLIVYLTKLKYIKYLKSYGLIHYVSRKMKYAVIYVDAESVNHILAKLRKLKYVRKVQLSYLTQINITELESNHQEDHDESSSR